MTTKTEMLIKKKILEYNGEDIAADTNILIRRLENPKAYSYIFNGKRIHASNFTITEFKRTFLRYCISLYNFMADKNDIMLVYNEIDKMRKDPKKSRESDGWNVILKTIGSQNNHKYVMGILKTYIRYALVCRFKENVIFFDTKANCDKRIRANEITKNFFILDIDCNNCSAFANYNKDDLINIRDGVISEDEFTNTIPLLDKIINEEKIDHEDCILLGDLIISLDNPEEIPLVTLDCKHIKPICDCIYKITLC